MNREILHLEADTNNKHQLTGLKCNVKFTL